SRLTHAVAGVAALFGRTGRHVARDEVAEARVAPFEEVIALVLRDLRGRPLVAFLLRHPDAPVVAEALAHQRELRLVVARDGDARRVDLRHAGIREEGAAPVAAPG